MLNPSRNFAQKKKANGLPLVAAKVFPLRIFYWLKFTFMRAMGPASLLLALGGCVGVCVFLSMKQALHSNGSSKAHDSVCALAIVSVLFGLAMLPVALPLLSAIRRDGNGKQKKKALEDRIGRLREEVAARKEAEGLAKIIMKTANQTKRPPARSVRKL